MRSRPTSIYHNFDKCRLTSWRHIEHQQWAPSMPPTTRKSFLFVLSLTSINCIQNITCEDDVATNSTVWYTNKWLIKWMMLFLSAETDSCWEGQENCRLSRNPNIRDGVHRNKRLTSCTHSGLLQDLFQCKHVLKLLSPTWWLVFGFPKNIACYKPRSFQSPWLGQPNYLAKCANYDRHIHIYWAWYFFLTLPKPFVLQFSQIPVRGLRNIIQFPLLVLSHPL